MSKVCLCLTASTIARNLEILESYRDNVDVAELRVDYLEADERFFIRRFPELAGIPTILTVRRKVDGGRFAEGEGARIVLLAKGLAFADADRRRNFAYVDLEEELNVPSLEEAARTFGTRIIRSYHNFHGVDEDLTNTIKKIRRTGDEIVKVALMPNSLEDVARVYQAADECEDIEKILLCMGPYGTNTRILAERLGSLLSFTTPKGLSGIEIAGEGQLDPKELVETYRFRQLKKDFSIYGIVGKPLAATSSPSIHNAAYGRAKDSAVYVPFPSDTLSSFLKLAEYLDLSGASVTVPYKEEILPYLSCISNEVQHIGSCNTILNTKRGWSGFNTDARGFSDSLLDLIDRKNLHRKKISIIGAGGVARAVAYEIHRLGGKACVLNRTLLRAKELADPYGFAWASLDANGIDMISRYKDIIIQTTSLGMEPDTEADPLELYNFSGKEVVMDLIYKPARTKMLERAEEAGCKTLNGYDMLLGQAKLQYKLFLGKDFPD